MTEGQLMEINYSWYVLPPVTEKTASRNRDVGTTPPPVNAEP
jgi:hypothetical protein